MADANLFMKQMQMQAAAKKASLSMTTGTSANPYAAALAARASAPPMSGYSINRMAMAQAQAEVTKLKGNDGLITALRRDQNPTPKPSATLLPTINSSGASIAQNAAANNLADNFDATAAEARRHADLAKTAKQRGDFRGALEHLANAARAAVKTHAMGRGLVDYKEKIARAKVVNSYMEQARLAKAQGNNSAAQTLANAAVKAQKSTLLPTGLPAALKAPPLQSNDLLQKYSHKYVRNGRQDGYVLAAKGNLNGIGDIEAMADSLKFSTTKIQTATRSAIGYLNRATNLAGLGFSTGIPIVDNNVNAASNAIKDVTGGGTSTVNDLLNAGKKLLAPLAADACASAASAARDAAATAATAQLKKTGADPNSTNFKNAVKAAGTNAYNAALSACKQATGSKSGAPKPVVPPTVNASSPSIGTGGAFVLAGAAALVAFKFLL